MAMKSKILSLFFWHLILFLLFYELREVLEQQSLASLREWLELKGGLLNASSFFVFFLYSLGSHRVLVQFYPQQIAGVFLGLLVVMISCMSFRYLLEEVIYLQFFGFDNFYDEMSLLLYGLGNLFYAILHMGLGVVFFFVHYSRERDQQAQALLLENKKTELAYLRSQVNPHFLFNTLNNIYSLVYQKSEQALPAIERLTTLLRYSLYEGRTWIPLTKELAMIRNFIQLEEMRYAYPLQVDLSLQGEPDDWIIPPFIFLPFVENAFKHGDLQKTLLIFIDLQSHRLVFQVKNKIPTNRQKEAVGGIGLVNIQKRLQLIYGSKYELKIDQTDAEFNVHLTISKHATD